MEDNEKDKFNEMILALATFYDKVLKSQVVDMYWDSLKKYDFRDLEFAAQKHLDDPEHCDFMPKPGDFIRHLSEPEKDPLIAWNEVCDAMFAIGSYRSVRFEDGFINKAIEDMGGWIWLCRQNLDEPWTQREFERRYKVYSKNKTASHRILQGQVEAENRLGGYDFEAPILIEDASPRKRISGPIMLPPPKKVQ